MHDINGWLVLRDTSDIEIGRDVLTSGFGCRSCTRTLLMFLDWSIAECDDIVSCDSNVETVLEF